MTTGRILLTLNDLSKATDEILHNAPIRKMFADLANSIRKANSDRLDELDSMHDAMNGTFLPEGTWGTGEYEEYIAAHEHGRIMDARAINERR